MLTSTFPLSFSLFLMLAKNSISDRQNVQLRQYVCHPSISKWLFSFIASSFSAFQSDFREMASKFVLFRGKTWNRKINMYFIVKKFHSHDYNATYVVCSKCSRQQIRLCQLLIRVCISSELRCNDHYCHIHFKFWV